MVNDQFIAADALVIASGALFGHSHDAALHSRIGFRQCDSPIDVVRRVHDDKLSLFLPQRNDSVSGGQHLLRRNNTAEISSRGARIECELQVRQFDTALTHIAELQRRHDARDVDQDRAFAGSIIGRAGARASRQNACAKVVASACHIGMRRAAIRGHGNGEGVAVLVFGKDLDLVSIGKVETVDAEEQVFRPGAVLVAATCRKGCKQCGGRTSSMGAGDHQRGFRIKATIRIGRHILPRYRGTGPCFGNREGNGAFIRGIGITSGDRGPVCPARNPVHPIGGIAGVAIGRVIGADEVAGGHVLRGGKVGVKRCAFHHGSAQPIAAGEFRCGIRRRAARTDPDKIVAATGVDIVCHKTGHRSLGAILFRLRQHNAPQFAVRGDGIRGRRFEVAVELARLGDDGALQQGSQICGCRQGNATTGDRAPNLEPVGIGGKVDGCQRYNLIFCTKVLIKLAVLRFGKGAVADGDAARIKLLRLGSGRDLCPIRYQSKSAGALAIRTAERSDQVLRDRRPNRGRPSAQTAPDGSRCRNHVGRDGSRPCGRYGNIGGSGDDHRADFCLGPGRDGVDDANACPGDGYTNHADCDADGDSGAECRDMRRVLRIYRHAAHCGTDRAGGATVYDLGRGGRGDAVICLGCGDGNRKPCKTSANREGDGPGDSLDPGGVGGAHGQGVDDDIQRCARQAGCGVSIDPVARADACTGGSHTDPTDGDGPGPCDHQCVDGLTSSRQHLRITTLGGHFGVFDQRPSPARNGGVSVIGIGRAGVA